MASKLSKITVVVTGLSLSLLAGCSWEVGARDGVIDGISVTVSAFITVLANAIAGGTLL